VIRTGHLLVGQTAANAHLRNTSRRVPAANSLFLVLAVLVVPANTTGTTVSIIPFMLSGHN
jgi:hypothetical protein